MENNVKRDKDKRNKNALQVMLYGVLFKENTSDKNSNVVPNLFLIKDIFKNDDFRLTTAPSKGTKIPFGDVSDYNDEFLNLIRETLQELFNKDVCFSQTKNVKTCEYCPYCVICRKESI